MTRECARFARSIKRTRAEPGVQVYVFSEEALERLSPYAEQVASDAKRDTRKR